MGRGAGKGGEKTQDKERQRMKYGEINSRREGMKKEGESTDKEGRQRKRGRGMEREREKGRRHIINTIVRGQITSLRNKFGTYRLLIECPCNLYTIT